MLLNSLGRVLVASGLVAVTSFMASTAAFADTKAAPITITGTVDSTLAITAKNPTSFVIERDHPTGWDVKLSGADLTFGTNMPRGLTVTVPSGLKLRSVDGGADIPFIVGLGSSGSTTAGVYLTNTYNTGVATSPTTAYDLYINYSSAPTQGFGVYKSDITFTATDNY